MEKLRAYRLRRRIAVPPFDFTDASAAAPPPPAAPLPGMARSTPPVMRPSVWSYRLLLA